MVRIIKDHESRRKEILETAQQLFYQKGYEQTSIQDLLTAIGIAKGTFYHYFSSKQALLEELVEHLADQNVALVAQLVSDEELDALQKLHQIFLQSNRWRAEQKHFVLSAMQAYYREENLRLRHALVNSTTARMIPLLTQVVEQGMAEGVFATAYPEEVALIIYRLFQEMIETIGQIILGAQSTIAPGTADLIARKIDVYQQSVERVLAAPTGAIQIFDAQIIFDKWIAPDGSDF